VVKSIRLAHAYICVLKSAAGEVFSMKERTNRSFWDHISGIYDRFMKKDQNAYGEMIRLIRERVTPNMELLELATGTGLIALAIADRVRRIEATDFSPNMISEAKKKAVLPNVRFSVQDACNLPYEDKSFDCVVISNALHIMPEPELALENIRRVLKDDGVLIAPTFTHAENGRSGKVKAALMERFGFHAYHKWTQQEYCAFLEQNGFSVCREQVLKSDFPLTYAEAAKNR
jgi:phosphatidylethanolamine/phosphatidyl-N-methylethanolamine N-methyltransferase